MKSTQLSALAESNSGKCEMGWFDAIVLCFVVGIFVLQLCGDEMTDELTKQGRILIYNGKSFGKIERIYLCYGRVILLCARKWLFPFYSCRCGPAHGESNQIPFRCQLTSRMLYQIWYCIAATVVNYLSEINLITKKMKRRYRLCLQLDVGIDDRWCHSSFGARNDDVVAFDKWIRSHLQRENEWRVHHWRDGRDSFQHQK